MERSWEVLFGLHEELEGENNQSRKNGGWAVLKGSVIVDEAWRGVWGRFGNMRSDSGAATLLCDLKTEQKRILRSFTMH